MKGAHIPFSSASGYLDFLPDLSDLASFALHYLQSLKVHFNVLWDLSKDL